MTRLLLSAESHRRIAPLLAPHLGRLELLLMDRQGLVTQDGRPVPVEKAQADAAWLTEDFYAEPAFKTAFLQAIDSALRFAWLQTVAAGVDNPIYQQLMARGVRVTNSHGQAVCIAEYVLGEVLAHYQRLNERRSAQAAHEWSRLVFRELGLSHWLLVGFGAIGQAVAARLRPFGARITAVRRDLAPHPLADALHPLSDVRHLATEADVVVMSPPLTRETFHLADAAFFAAMKPGSVFVNVGRGGLVDEPALLAALDAGKPERAVLDVFETEPLPPESRFWSHPRVALSAHASSFGSSLSRRNDAHFIENLVRFADGRPLVSEVDSRDLASP